MFFVPIICELSILVFVFFVVGYYYGNSLSFIGYQYVDDGGLRAKSELSYEVYNAI